MFQTAVALLLAHVIADFLLQTRGMVVHKHRPTVFALHGFVVLASTALCLGFAPGHTNTATAALLLVVLSHIAIDALKTHGLSRLPACRHGFGPTWLFVGDQIAHLLFIGLAVGLYPQAFAAGIWPDWLAPDVLAALATGAVVAIGFMTATAVGNILLALFMPVVAAGAPVEAATDSLAPGAANGMPRAGAWIGVLERSLVFFFVLMGQFGAIGFVIAAKSILRFQYARQAHQSELVIIGTLASFGWAIGAAELTRRAINYAAGGG